MLADRIEAKWIDAFCEIFERCAVKPGDTAAILSETQSRALNVHLAELALLRMGAQAVSHRGADAAQPADRADPLHRRQRSDPAAGARRDGAAAGGLRGRLHHRRTDACGGDAGNPQSRRAHSGHFQRTSRGARAHGAGHGAGKAGARGGEDAARNQADARDLEGGHRARRRHGRRLDGRRLGLDRQAGHAGALAGRHRRQLSQERHRQWHAGDGAPATSISPSSAI